MEQSRVTSVKHGKKLQTSGVLGVARQNINFITDESLCL